MKVIDLLNKIANGEEVPRHIKHKGMNLYWNEENYVYDIIEETFRAPFYLFHNDELNDEIKIIEEPKKIETNLKKMLIPSIQFNLGYINTNDKEVVIKEMNKTIQDLYDRTLALNTQINEIIDYINKGE